MLREFGALALAASMFVSSTAFAATKANQGALAPGKPASVSQAQSFKGRTTLLWLLGVGVVVGGIVLVASGNNNGTAATSTTSQP